MVHALGTTREQILGALAAGRTGLAPPDPSLLSAPLGFETAVGAVPGPLPELPRELQPRSTRLAQFGLQLVQQLDEPLRRARERWRPERIALLLGTSTAGAATTERAYRAFVTEGRFPGGYDFRLQHTYGAVLDVLRALTGACGPALMVSTACTSGAKPFATARRWIAADLIDAALVGGIDTLCNLTLHGFHALQALDREPCRPFGEGRRGISIGEGGALALVERSGEARVLVEGVGETSDAYHISAPHPQGAGALAAMGAALEQAGLRPAEVDHVNAHGTGTRLNDSAEAQAIAAVFGPEVPVVSTKGYTGHTLGAAGAIEFAFAACAVEEGWIPASLGAERRDPEIALRLPSARTAGSFRHVLSNSFAFGGNNVSLLVGAP
jgi:3-oxoacyl-[acyl-carrier-protein] synthase-1